MKPFVRRQLLQALVELKSARGCLYDAFQSSVGDPELDGFLARLRADVCTSEAKLHERLCREVEGEPKPKEAA